MAALNHAAALALLAAATTASAAAAPPMPQVEAWGPNSFRVRWAAPGYPLAESPYTPYVLQSEANAKLPASAAPRTFEKAPGVLASVNGNLEIDVDAATGLVSVIRVSDGHLLMQQTALLWSNASCYGAPCPSADLPPSAELQFNGYITEVFVGGGEQGTRRRVTLEENFGRDYADTEYYGYNSGRQAFLPLFFSSVGYGFMNAQPGYGHMQWQSAVEGAPLATPGVQQSVFNASSIKVVDVWFTTTPGTPVFNETTPHPYLSLLDQYADAVGHAPLMPAFASGFIASKDRYRNQSQIMDVARGYISRNIPISMLTIDCERMCARVSAHAERKFSDAATLPLSLTLLSLLLALFCPLRLPVVQGSTGPRWATWLLSPSAGLIRSQWSTSCAGSASRPW